MALEPGSALRTSSPVSSRSSSPANPKPQASADDEAFKKDKSYRRYASGVERALSLFDTALQEWADYISFLGRLLKTDALSRDLALYLPGLSSTLSFAALSVKPIFLSLIESYLVILDPSALRPALKAIILCLLPGLEEESSEDFERTLRLLNGFRRNMGGKQVTTPGQEDGSGDQYFWQCLFLASITSPSRRPGALAYLVRSLPKLASSTSLHRMTNGHESRISDGDQLALAAENVLSPEPGLLIRCFAAGLGDDQLLIQRGFLDLLVTHLPLHSSVLQDRVTGEDLERLVIAAAGVVARRDMSLNRRLWTWFLGPHSSPGGEESIPSSPNSPSPEDVIKPSGNSAHRRTRYFNQYGLQPLVNSIRSMVDKRSSAPAERVRPFRICLSLLDRWEIGGLVIPKVFLPIVESVREYESLAESKDAFNEVLRSGNVFFDGVESGLIWGEILGQLTAALGETDDDLQIAEQPLALARFMVTRFNLQEEEMLVVHIPTVTLALLSMLVITVLRESPHPEASRTKLAGVLTIAFGLAEELIDMVPVRAFLMSASTLSSVPLSGQTHQRTSQSKEIVSSIRKFYIQDHGNLEISSPPLSSREVGELLLRETTTLLTLILHSKYHVSTLAASVSLLNALLHKVPYSENVRSSQLFSVFLQALKPATIASQTDLPFPGLSAIVSCLASLCQNASSKHYFSDEQLSHLTPILVRKLWFYLAPSNPKYHVEAVRCIWRLHTLTRQDRLVEASITTLMVDDSCKTMNGLNSEAGRCFAILWAHCAQLSDGLPDNYPAQDLNKVVESKGGNIVHDHGTWLIRPLFLLLDALIDEETEISIFVRGWLRNLPSIIKIFYAILAKLQTRPSLSLVALDRSNQDREEHFNADDVEECRYFLQTTRNVLQCVSTDTWMLLANQLLHVSDEQDERSST
ncbi:MAG: hypothetical protein M1830_004122, partial [Pleopsidium flavum]